MSLGNSGIWENTGLTLFRGGFTTVDVVVVENSEAVTDPASSSDTGSL